MESEAELYARIGRQAVQIDQKTAAFNQVLGIFADVLEGKVDPRRVLINRTEGRLEVAPDGFSATTPATINGVPVCAVYAPFKFPEPVAPEPVKAYSRPLRTWTRPSKVSPELPPPQDPPGGSD